MKFDDLLDEESKQISESAIRWIKSNRKFIIEKFCSLKEYPPSKKPFMIFMAGSPGAGKTEFSKSMIPILQKKDPDHKIVRIDIDEVRCIIPEYNGRNSSVIQTAAAIGVEKIFDHVQGHNQNAFMDSTFSSFSKADSDVSRCLNRNRDVGIFYIYQEPSIAWEFTKKREALDGRIVPKEVFIESFLKAKETCNLIKQKYGNQINLDLIIKNFENSLEKSQFNIVSIDSYLEKIYNIDLLQELIK